MLRPAAQILGRSLALLLGLALAGLALLAAVDALVPMPRVAAALVAAEAEGRFGETGGTERPAGFEINHFSDCIGLTVAASGLGPGLAFTLRSRAALWHPGTSMCHLAAQAARHPERADWFDYSRYWHGYRLLLFPAAAAGGYAAAQAAGAVVLLLGLGGLAVVVLARFGWLAAVALLALLAGLGGLPLAYATPTHAASLAVLLGGSAVLLRRFADRPVAILLPAAFGLGAIYNFADFFYNPEALAVLAGGLAGLDAASRRPPVAAALVGGATAVSTLAGYAAFWATKWALVLPLVAWGGAASPVLTGDFGRWAAAGDAPYEPLAATAHLVWLSFGGPVALGLGAAALGLVGLALWRRPGPAARALVATLPAVAAGLVAVEAAAGHSLAHAAFTMRVVPVALAVLAVAAASALGSELDKGWRFCCCFGPEAEGEWPKSVPGARSRPSTLRLRAQNATRRAARLAAGACVTRRSWPDGQSLLAPAPRPRYAAAKPHSLSSSDPRVRTR